LPYHPNKPAAAKEGISAFLEGRRLEFKKWKRFLGGCPKTMKETLARGQTSVPFMVRYPFDTLRAVSKVEPLTTNGN
jgi:hypothetical protein